MRSCDSEEMQRYSDEDECEKIRIFIHLSPVSVIWSRYRGYLTLKILNTNTEDVFSFTIGLVYVKLFIIEIEKT